MTPMLAWTFALALAAAPGDRIDLAPIGATSGVPVVVNVWASWCGPCREELPALDALAVRLGPDALVIAVSADATPGRPRALVKHLELSLPVVYDATALLAALAPPSMPTTYVLDAHGVVRNVHEGALDAAGVLALEGDVRALRTGP